MSIEIIPLVVEALHSLEARKLASRECNASTTWGIISILIVLVGSNYLLKVHTYLLSMIWYIIILGLGPHHICSPLRNWKILQFEWLKSTFVKKFILAFTQNKFVFPNFKPLCKNTPIQKENVHCAAAVSSPNIWYFYHI